MANSSLTISFATTTGSTDQFIDLELDDDLNGDKTTFLFGEIVYFRVFTNCTTLDFYPTEGSVAANGTGTADIVEQITFTEPPLAAGGIVSENTSSLGYPANDGSFSAVVLGSGSGCGTISVDSVDTKQANASQADPGVYTATYKSDYLGKKITGPTMPVDWDTEESYPVVIVVVGS